MTARTPTLTEADVPSLAIVEDALALGDSTWRDRENNLDTKAGILLSGAGVIVALVGTTAEIAALVSQVLAIVAGGAAVWSLWPRLDKVIDPGDLSSSYLTADPVSTRLRVLNSRLDIHSENERALLAKGRRWKLTALLLLGSVVAIVSGGIVDTVRR
jgi:hypothetical protein